MLSLCLKCSFSLSSNGWLLISSIFQLKCNYPNDFSWPPNLKLLSTVRLSKFLCFSVLYCLGTLSHFVIIYWFLCLLAWLLEYNFIYIIQHSFGCKEQKFSLACLSQKRGQLVWFKENAAPQSLSKDPNDEDSKTFQSFSRNSSHFSSVGASIRISNSWERKSRKPGWVEFLLLDITEFPWWASVRSR